jgi:hypothetical protein
MSQVLEGRLPVKNAPSRCTAPGGAVWTLTRKAISSAANNITTPSAMKAPVMPLKLNITPPAAAPVAMEGCTEATTMPPALFA